MTASDDAAGPQPLLPKDCTSMEDVRRGVDALDQVLVGLLRIRQDFMEAAARIKPSRDAVYDAERIEAVVAGVMAEAERAGLSAGIAEPVWRVLIERCINYEFDAWDRLRAGR